MPQASGEGVGRRGTLRPTARPWARELFRSAAGPAPTPRGRPAEAATARAPCSGVPCCGVLCFGVLCSGSARHPPTGCRLTRRLAHLPPEASLGASFLAGAATCFVAWRMVIFICIGDSSLVLSTISVWPEIGSPSSSETSKAPVDLSASSSPRVRAHGSRPTGRESASRARSARYLARRSTPRGPTRHP